MPKKSTVAIATTSNTSIQSIEQAQAQAFENMPLFAVYVYIDKGEDVDGITHGVPRFVAYCTDRDEAKRKGLNALTNTENAITCDIQDLSATPWALKMEGVDNQGWVSGKTFYLPTEQDALDKARELFDNPRYGLEFKEAWIKNLKLDYFAGVAQPPKHHLTNFTEQGELRIWGAL